MSSSSHSSHRCGFHSETGLSLIECLAAIVILGTAIVAGLSMFGMHETLASSGSHATQGYLLLEREADRVLNEDYSELETTTYEPFEDQPDYETCRVVSQMRSDVKLIEVYVRWTQDNSVTREHSVPVLSWEGD